MDSTPEALSTVLAARAEAIVRSGAPLVGDGGEGRIASDMRPCAPLCRPPRSLKSPSRGLFSSLTSPLPWPKLRAPNLGIGTRCLKS